MDADFFLQFDFYSFFLFHICVYSLCYLCYYIFWWQVSGSSHGSLNRRYALALSPLACEFRDRVQSQFASSLSVEYVFLQWKYIHILFLELFVFLFCCFISCVVYFYFFCILLQVVDVIVSLVDKFVSMKSSANKTKQS